MLNIALEDWFGALQPDPFKFGILVTLSVAMIALIISNALRSRSTLRRRTSINDNNLNGETDDRRSIHFGNQLRVDRIVERAGRLLAPKSEENLSVIRQQIVQAGFLSPLAVSIYYTLRLLTACALPLGFVLFSGYLPIEVPNYLIILCTTGLAVIGLIIPGILLDWRRSVMRQRYRITFPELMDLLVVCIESGQSLNGALERVGKEFTKSCPELGANIHLVCLEIRAGRTLTEALDGLSERLGIDEVNSLKLLLKQSQELGASIADSLRVYSDEMRDKRLMRAEALANALPVKMTLPLGLFIFPVILLLIMIPVIIRIKNAF